MQRISGAILIIVTMGIFFFMNSCERNEDIMDPVINITSPAENQLYQIPESMEVVASITDETALEWVKVVVVDDNQTPLFPSQTFYPGGLSMNLNETYLLDNIHLESGKYYLKVSASDGINLTNAFVAIFLNEVPRTLDALLIITQKGENMEVLSYPGSNQPEKLFETIGDFSASAISSRNQQLYLSGLFTLNFEAWDLEYRSLNWSLDPIPNPPFHDPDNLFSDEYWIFVSFREGYIRAYDQNGVNKFATAFTQETEPTQVYHQDDYIIAELIEKSGYKRFLANYYTVSGIIKDKKEINYNIIGFYKHDNHSVFVVSNDQQTGNIQLYDLVTGFFSQLHEITSTVSSCVAVDDNNLLLAGEQAIYWYRYDINSLVSITENKKAFRLLYEDIDRLIYLIRGHEVEIIRFPYAQPVKVIPVTDTILNAHLLYNK